MSDQVRRSVLEQGGGTGEEVGEGDGASVAFASGADAYGFVGLFFVD